MVFPNLFYFYWIPHREYEINFGFSSVLKSVLLKLPNTRQLYRHDKSPGFTFTTEKNYADWQQFTISNLFTEGTDCHDHLRLHNDRRYRWR